jgi:cellulose synthase/poly-beta-1,6-N-acetylglucosamine synthase-like glycosyltransferase
MFLEHAWMVLALLVLLAYGGVLFMFVTAFKRRYKSNKEVISGLSIVVSIRNEAESIESFFKRLVACKQGEIDLEVIVVNDHSTDDSLARMEQNKLPLNIRVLNPPKEISGKKRCMKHGIKAAQHPWLLTLDVDTRLPISFFVDIQDAISENIRYCIVPLTPKKNHSLARYFFDLEFISLHFVGMASAQLGKPLLSNAACSVFRKDAFLETVDDRNDWDISSGDDVFAMFAIAKKYGKGAVGVASLGSTIVEVDFPNNFSALWYQRLRWVGKSGQIKNVWFVFISVLVLSFNLLLGSTFVLTFFHDFSTNHFVFVLAAIVIQFWFLTYVCNAVQRRDLKKWIVPLTLVYPFYLIALVIAQFFWKPKWK